MTGTSQKMFEIASHLNELNNDGKVKAFRGSEKGYAKVIELCRGCSIFVHHEKNDDLIIDLLVSPNAKEKKPPLCGNAINRFKEFFNDSCKISMSNWSHPINTQKDHERYYVDVNEKNTSEIIPTTIHKVKAPMQPVSVSDERDKPDGSSSVSMRQAQ